MPKLSAEMDAQSAAGSYNPIPLDINRDWRIIVNNRFIAMIAPARPASTNGRSVIGKIMLLATARECLKPDFHHMVRAVITGAALLIGQGVSAEELPLGPGDAPKPNSTFADFTLTRGAEHDLCRGVEKGFRENSLIPSPSEVCGVPFPAGDADFQSLPEWRELDPSRHMDIVQEIFYFSNIRKNQIGEDAWKRQWQGSSMLPDILEKVWRPSEVRIKALIAAGRVSLQSNRFDIDNDGIEEVVYRMTGFTLQMSNKKKSDGTWEQTLDLATFAAKRCRRSVPGWDDTTYFYMMERGGKRSMLPKHNSVAAGLIFFRYRARTYLAFNGGGAIEETIPTSLPNFPGVISEQLCHFGLIAEEN